MSARISFISRISARPQSSQASLPAIWSRSFSRFARTAPAAEVVKALKEDGCIVIESMLPSSQVARLNRDMDIALANITPGRPANANTAPLPEGADPAVFGAKTKRLGNMLNSSATFREDIVNNDSLHNISAEIFKETGDYWLSTAQMIEIGPGTKAQPLHPDAVGWWPFWSMGEKWMPEFAVNFLIAATDTTKENGATGVVRGSHKMSYANALDNPSELWKYSDDEVEQVELKAGDCLLLGGRIVHRGEENKTDDEYRRILSCTIISSALTPEEAHPLLLEGDKAKELSERAKKFLGFRELSTTIGPDVWQDHRKGGLRKALGF